MTKKQINECANRIYDLEMIIQSKESTPFEKKQAQKKISELTVLLSKDIKILFEVNGILEEKLLKDKK